MACMEHDCLGCGHTKFNNNTKMKEPCEQCGGRYFGSTHDEFGSAGSHWVNVHTCDNCKKVQYNNRDEASSECECGCKEFMSQIENEERLRPTTVTSPK